MAKGDFTCSKCGRSFGMAAHLARHMSTIHASPQKRAAAKRKRAAAKRKKAGTRKRAVGRPKKKVKKVRRAKGRTLGRPTGVVARLGLRSLALEQLCEVIEAAQAEARRKMADIQKALK